MPALRWLNLRSRRFRFFPDVTEEHDPQGGGDGDRQNAAQQSTEQGYSDHHSDDDHDRMQADPIAHDLRRVEKAFQRLHDGEHDGYQQWMQPVAVLHYRQDESQDAGDDGADERDDRED